MNKTVSTNEITSGRTMDFNIGDKITISGMYEKRTFWQWLTRKKPTPQVFTIKEKTTSKITYD